MKNWTKLFALILVAAFAVALFAGCTKPAAEPTEAPVVDEPQGGEGEGEGEAEVEKDPASFTGTILQRPPAYSAIKIGGKPLYALARKGEMVVAKSRETLIRSLSLGEQVAPDAYMLHVDCGSGTYIRTLCHDIGRHLQAPAHMRFLLRTRHGAFSIENSITLEEVAQAAENGTLSSLLLPLDYPLQALPRLDLTVQWATPVKNGAKLPLSLAPHLAEDQLFRVYLAGALCGIYRKDADTLHCAIGLYSGE